MNTTRETLIYVESKISSAISSGVSYLANTSVGKTVTSTISKGKQIYNTVTGISKAASIVYNKVIKPQVERDTQQKVEALKKGISVVPSVGSIIKDLVIPKVEFKANNISNSTDSDGEYNMMPSAIGFILGFDQFNILRGIANFIQPVVGGNKITDDDIEKNLKYRSGFAQAYRIGEVVSLIGALGGFRGSPTMEPAMVTGGASGASAATSAQINPGFSFFENGKNGAKVEAEAKLGGSHKEVPANGGQVHHMLADSISPFTKNEGPGIRMDTRDHMETASWGSSKKAKEYRLKQKALIEQGKFKEAQQMDIDDVRLKFNKKYDKGIEQMEKYTDELLKKNK